MKFTIVGGGNIGTLIAVHCAEKGHEVTIVTSSPEVFQKDLKIVDEKGEVLRQGRIFRATNDPREGYKDADCILVTLPANLIGPCAEAIYTYASKDAWIGVVPGNGGSECMFRPCIERGNTFFLIQRVPSIARLVTRGSVVKSTGYKSRLYVSSLPNSMNEECGRLLEDLFEIPCEPVDGILNLTLTPSNPILHTTRIRALFETYSEGVVYERIPLFYEEWDDASSRLLLACDRELQEICRALPELKLDHVVPLSEYYESPDAASMTRKLSSIAAFKGIGTPSVRVDGGYIPDLHSRYFTADFSYGLRIIQQIGEFAKVDIPNINETMEWYERIAVEKASFDYADYGITDRDSLVKYYSM